jgi:hypothetical protein
LKPTVVFANNPSHKKFRAIDVPTPPRSRRNQEA